MVVVRELELLEEMNDLIAGILGVVNADLLAFPGVVGAPCMDTLLAWI